MKSYEEVPEGENKETTKEAKVEDEPSNDDKAILDEAKKRFDYCEEMEAENIALYEQDLRFANGDSDNRFQWEESASRYRDIENKPCVTVNKVKQHNLQISNEALKGRSSPKVVPVDGGSDGEVAEIFNGLIKHIESQSNAASAYGTATQYAVDAGIGYWYVGTRYADEETLDQEIFIGRVDDPLSIRTDPDIKSADGSDMRYGFIYSDIARDDFIEKYGSDTYGEWTGNEKASDWDNKETIRICEYYRKVEDYSDITVGGKKRQACKKTVEWYLLTDKAVIDRKVWPGKYVPIVRLTGLETKIGGKTMRTSHTRPMKDAQRIYNMWSSCAVEFVLMQGKQPYIAAVEAIEGNEKYWDNLNRSNYPYLPFNARDEDGTQIPAPKRQEPPIMPQAYMEGMRISAMDMQSASGQYDGTFGKNVNQQSGVALRQVQRQGETATFHYVDSSDMAKRLTCCILVDLIPKIYDTSRVAMIIGEDGSQKTVEIDPSRPDAITKERANDGSIRKIYNPNVGKYDVISSVGASYETKRQESAESMIAMSQANPAIWQTHGDIIARSQDWPMAEEFAKRFEKIMPPGLLGGNEEGGGPSLSPQLQQAQQAAEQSQAQLQQMAESNQQQLQQLDQVIQKMSAELESKELESQLAVQKIQVDMYNAETNRLKVQRPELPVDNQMERQRDEAEIRKANAQARLAEIEVMKSSSEIVKLENEEMTPQIEELSRAMAIIAESNMAIQEAIVKVAEMAEMATRPRRSTIELDGSGMPISAVSEIVEYGGEPRWR